MRVLNVAEKPSVAKEISRIASRGTASRANSASKYNPIFEFPYQLENTSVTMVFTSIQGHLMETDFEDQYRGWSACSPIELFQAPIKRQIPADKMDMGTNLERLSRSCQWLVLWLDCDREGENICFEVMEVCLRANPRLRISRAHFSALTPRDVERACRTLGQPNKRYSDAVQARQEIDLRLGASFTRFQTFRLQNKFEGLPDGVISYGPCQFPTLGFVVERWQRIHNFQAEQFWYISCAVERPDADAKSGSLKVDFNWTRTRLYDRISCFILFEMCVDNPLATVVSVTSNPKSKWRPLPLSTVEMQKNASRKLQLSSHTTMQLAESLYNKGYISYPRTETDKFKDTIDVRALVSNQSGHPVWGAYAQRLDQGEFLWPRAGSNDDQAHPPIHPVKCGAQADMEPNEWKLYEYITRHFLAACSQDAQGHKTVVTINIAGETFTATGLMVLALNWLEVYRYDKWSDHNIPVFNVGEQFIPQGIWMKDGKTQAPPLLSESDLISLMDKSGIGTDATIHEHINTIQERNYAEKNGSQQLQPTPLGLALVEAYESMGFDLSKPFLRARMEADMKLIAQGVKTKDQVLTDCLNEMKTVFQTVASEAIKIEQSVAKYYAPMGTTPAQMLRRNFSKCGRCGSDMNLMANQSSDQRNNTNGNRATPTGRIQRFVLCAQCKVPNLLPPRGELSVTDVNCPLCNFQVIRITTEQNTTYTVCPSCFKNPPANVTADSDLGQDFPCFKCAFEGCTLSRKKRDDTPVFKCFKCKNNFMVLRKSQQNNYFLSCKGYPNCKNSVFLPKCITDATVLDTSCVSCSNVSLSAVRHVSIKFSLANGMIPPHLRCNFKGPEGNQHTACLGGCDHILSELGYRIDRIGDSTMQHPPRGAAVMAPRASQTTLATSFRALNNGFGNGSADYNVNNNNAPRKPQQADPSFKSFQHSGSVQPSVQQRDNTFADDTIDDSGFDSAIESAPPRTSSSFQPLGHRYNQPTTTSSSSFSSFRNQEDASSGAPMCTHNQPCIRLTAKNGANAGRVFFKCPKPSGQCESFFWEDELNNGSNGSASVGNGRSFVSSSSATSRSRPSDGGGWSSSSTSSNTFQGSSAKGGFGSTAGSNLSSVECYKCHQMGHFANNCPNGSSTSGSARPGHTRSFSENVPPWQKPSQRSHSRGGGFHDEENVNELSGTQTKKKRQAHCNVCGIDGRHEKGSSCASLKRNRKGPQE